MRAGAKSYMRKGFLIYLVIYEEAVVICDFATAPFWICLYMRKFIFYQYVLLHRECSDVQRMRDVGNRACRNLEYNALSSLQ
jgi:hypothetical protein